MRLVYSACALALGFAFSSQASSQQTAKPSISSENGKPSEATVAPKLSPPTGLTAIYTPMGRRLLLDPPDARTNETIFVSFHAMWNASSDFAVKYCGKVQSWTQHPPLKQFEAKYKKEYAENMKMQKEETPRKKTCEDVNRSIELDMDRFNAQFSFYAKFL